MSSRKHKHDVPAVAQELPRRKSNLWVILGVGLIAGVVFGAGFGIAVFFAKRPVIDLGVVTATTIPSPGVAVVPAGVPDEELFATYAGSSSCRACHAKAYEAWAGSHHGLAEREPDAAVDRPAFEPARAFDHGTQRTEVRARGDRFEVVTPGPDGAAAATYPVARVIGVDPLRQYLVPATGGRMQTLEASYDPHKNQWFNVYGNEDRKFGEWGHWAGRGMNWNAQCASCHNTRVRKNYDEASDSYQTAMAQASVSCESCHGPMKAHVDAKKTGALGGSEASASGKPYRFTKDQTLDACAACHARRADLTGDFAPGDAFADHFSLSVPDLSDLFHADGQVRDEDYEFTAFLGSKMHGAGVRCGDCHEPHSAKPLFAGNALCMRCHNGSFQGSPIIVPEAHSSHKADSAGNQCVNCHMPQTTYMQRHARHDHGFTIPDPLLTKEHGVPNACNRCHTDKDVDWAVAAADRRYGAKMQRPSRERARAVAKARRGDDDARGPILRMLTGEKQALWRASAAAILSQWVGAPEVPAALITAATADPDALVRENAAMSLGPVALRRDPAGIAAMTKRLDDPARAVRIRAAWALRDGIDPASVAGRDLERSLQVNADQPAGAVQQGAYYAVRGEMERAAGYYEKAVAWDPNSAPIRDALADVLTLRGQTERAAEQLRWAVHLNPRESFYAYKLALVYQRLGKLQQAREAARRVLEISPNDAAAAELLKALGP